MQRHAALLASLALVLVAAAPAQAGRVRGPEVLDSDALSLPLLEEEGIFYLTLVRSPDGRIALRDRSAGSPLRTTPLGFSYPSGSTFGSYTAAPDGHVWAAVSMAQGLRVYDLGDLTQPGPLAPVLIEAGAVEEDVVPEQTQMGIIAVLIGLLVEPRPSLALTSVTDGTSNTIMFAFDGRHFTSVVQDEDGTWSFNGPE